MKWIAWKNRPKERWAMRLVLLFTLIVGVLIAADFFVFETFMEPRGGDLRPLIRVEILHPDGTTDVSTEQQPPMQRGDRARVHVPLPPELSRLQGTLAFTAEHVCLRASWHGRVLDRYGMGDVEPYKLFGKVTRIVPIPEEAWGDEIVLEMTAMQDQAHVFLAPVYVMDATESWQYPLEKNLVFFLLFLAALVIMLAVLPPLVALGWHLPIVRRGVMLNLFCIDFLVWMFGYQSLLPVVFHDPYRGALIEYGALYLLAVPFFFYQRMTETEPQRRTIYSCACAFFAAIFVCAALGQTLGYCMFKELLPTLHIALFVCIVALVWFKFHPTRPETHWDVLFRHGFLATFLAGVLGMSQYYLFNYYGFSLVFLANKFIASGLILFLLTVVVCYVYRFIDQVLSARETRIYKRMALQDTLTGLLSRAGCFDAARHLAFDAPYAVLFFDVNGLKEANDLYGHAAGDRLLCVTADVLRDIFSPAMTGTIAARVGGDEFVVIVPEVKMRYVPQLIRAVRDELRRLGTQDGYPNDTSISCGVSENDPAHPKSFEEHIKIADDRMYAEKNRYKREKYGGRRASDRVFLRSQDDPEGGKDE